MSSRLKVIHKQLSKLASRQTSYGIVSLLDVASPRGWGAGIARVTGTLDLAGADPDLVSVGHRVRTALRPTALCEGMLAHGSDKALGVHNYSAFYHALLAPSQARIRRVFEIGIGSVDPLLPYNMGRAGTPGASLRGWRDFLPNAQIFGADIDRSILTREDRIACFFCDQTDSQSIAQLWANPELAEGFDVIVDDGLHEFEANVCFFENSMHKMAANGTYFVEDVKWTDLPKWQAYLAEPGTSAATVDWAIVTLRHPFNEFDNNIVAFAHRK